MSDWIVTVTTQAAVSRDVIKRHCRVPLDYVDDDVLIDDYIAAAVSQVERVTERVLSQATARYYGNLCHGKCWDSLVIKCLPLLPEQGEDPELDPLRDGIVTVEYLDTDGDYQEIDSAYWQLANPGQEPAVLLVKPGYTPNIDLDSPTPYKVTIRVGYATLPPAAKQAIKLWAGECYRFREVLVYGQTSATFKVAFDAECRELQWRFKS